MANTLQKIRGVVRESINNPREFPAAWARRQIGKAMGPVEAILRARRRVDPGAHTFASLSSMPSDELIPPLDKGRVDEGNLTPDQRSWRREGVVHLPKFMPEELMDAYCAVRAKHKDPGGWPCPVPYMHVPELAALGTYRPLTLKLKELLTEEMGLSLSLTGWVSTDRAWHQDDYLNPDFVNSWYAAVWIALEDIHPDSGPFHYVPGSHRWPILRGQRVKDLLSPEEAETPSWPIHGERFTTPALEAELRERGLTKRVYLPKRGDVLIWHGRLMHRGSVANVPGMSRKALICHYNSVKHRPDWPNIAWTKEGAPYFLQDIPLDKAEGARAS